MYFSYIYIIIKQILILFNKKFKIKTKLLFEHLRIITILIKSEILNEK